MRVDLTCVILSCGQWERVNAVVFDRATHTHTYDVAETHNTWAILTMYTHTNKHARDGDCVDVVVVGVVMSGAAGN